MRRRITIRGRVRPSVRPSVGPYVPCYFRGWKVRPLGASCAVYPLIFNTDNSDNNVKIVNSNIISNVHNFLVFLTNMSASSSYINTTFVMCNFSNNHYYDIYYCDKDSTN